MMNKKEKKPFKREYLPVIFAVIILILLIGALVFTILYKRSEKEIHPEESTIGVQEILINTNNSSMSQKELLALVDEAKKAKVTYELVDIFVGYTWNDDEVPTTGTEDTPPEDENHAVYTKGLYIEFTDVPENCGLFVTSANGVIKDKEFERKEDGIFLYYTSYIHSVDTYTVEIKAKVDGEYKDTVRKFSFETPMYNEWAESLFCQSHLDNDYCSELTFKEFTTAEFGKEVSRVSKKEEDSKYNIIKEQITVPTEEKEESNFFKDNMLYIVIGCVVLVGGVAATVIIKKKGSSKK